MPPITFELGQVSLQKHVAAGYVPGNPNSPSHPHMIFARAHPGHVWVVADRVLTDPGLRWLEVHDGKHVMVPLAPYLVELTEVEFVFGFGFQFAAMALANLPFNVASVYLALARPAEEIEYEGVKKFRVHAGVALRTR